MPVQSWAHTAYWDGKGSSGIVNPPSTGLFMAAQYPAWQASGFAASMFGGLGEFMRVLWGRLCWWMRMAPRLHRLDPERRAVLQTVITALESPAYPLASRAVAETAQTMGFRNPRAWFGLNEMMSQSASLSENTFRHMKACMQVKQTLSSTITNPECNLVVELAYHGFASRPKRTMP